MEEAAPVPLVGAASPRDVDYFSGLAGAEAGTLAGSGGAGGAAAVAAAAARLASVTRFRLASPSSKSFPIILSMLMKRPMPLAMKLDLPSIDQVTVAALPPSGLIWMPVSAVEANGSMNSSRSLMCVGAWLSVRVI